MNKKSELLFLKVPPPKSGNVVDYLVRFPEVEEAAAVYTDIDVVAHVVGTEARIQKFIDEKINGLGRPIEHVDRCPIGKIVKGPAANKGRYRGHSSVCAFVRCYIDTRATNFEFVIQRLSSLPGVQFLFPSEEKNEVIAKVMVSDKLALDETIMSKIQESGMITRTRTYFTISDMHWCQSGIPRSRKDYQGNAKEYPIFMGLSEKNLSFGLDLCEQIYRDTRVRVWNYSLIETGKEHWSKEVDYSIESAAAFLFLVTPEFLESKECQREFGKIEGLAKPGSICCLVLPPTKMVDLPGRFQNRQCVDGSKFFSYSTLLRWISDTI